MIKYWINNQIKRSIILRQWITSGRGIYEKLHINTSMHIQMVQCNAWLHFRQLITSGGEICETFISTLQCTCKWCNAMHDFTSTHKTQGRKWGLQPHCYISMCVAVPVLTALIRLWFLHMHIQYESAKAMIAMHELHIPPEFIAPRAMPKINKHIIQQNKAKFWSYLASVSF